MATLLEQLKKVTTVVADTGDINSIEKFKPTDSTTNPSLIAAAAEKPEYQQIVDDVLKEARAQAGNDASDNDVAAFAFKTLAVAFGRKILDIVPGRVSTEVDARMSFDREKTLEQARDIIAQYDKAGISRARVLVEDRLHLGGHQGRGDPRAGGHPLQPDAALRPAPGHRVRRSQGDADLAFRRVAFWIGTRRTPARTTPRPKIPACSR